MPQPSADHLAAELQTVLENTTDEFTSAWFGPGYHPPTIWTPTEAELEESPLGHLLARAASTRTGNRLTYAVATPDGTLTLTITLDLSQLAPRQPI